jgi:NADPH-dependent 2,4-dienoyl-CoA reductase/sulfur reductase-like enzyme
MKNKKFLIIGGNAAGMSAASRIRRNDKSAEIIVLEKSNIVSYGACGLPYFISDDIKQETDLIARTLLEFKEKSNIDIHLQHEVYSLDPRKRSVSAQAINKGEHITYNYDKLLISTGAKAIIPDIPGTDLDNVFALKSMEDGVRIKSLVQNGKIRKAVIAGGGYIGLEMAEALHKQNIDVTIVEMQNRLMKNVDEDISQQIELELQSHDCDVIKNDGLQSLSGKQSVEEVHLHSGKSINADMVLFCVGIKPKVSFAKKSGLHLGKSGAIAINPRMQTNIPNVYAAGDCAEVKNLVSNKFEYIPLGTTANKQGRIAGDNMSGKISNFKGVTATAVVKVFDLEVARAGLTLVEAEAIKMNVKSISISSRSRAHYYPGHQPITVKLIFESASGRLLGGQIIGKEGAAKRIDVLATALHQKMTVGDISELDLSYAPPYAPVWDPILIAAQQAQKMIRGKKS